MLLGASPPESFASHRPVVGCAVAYRPELLQCMPRVQLLRHSAQPWDLSGAWWLEASVRYQTGRIECVEFAVVPAAGVSILAAAGEVLEQMCVIDAEVYAFRRPMSAETIAAVQQWNAQQVKRLREPAQSARGLEG